MGVLGMLAEAFPMIARDDDEELSLLSLQGRDQAPNLGVHVGDFAVVRSRGKLARERFGRLVLRVRVVVVDPEEERLLVLPALEPFESRLGDGFGVTLPKAAEGLSGESLGSIVVAVEALRESVSRVENERRKRTPQFRSRSPSGFRRGSTCGWVEPILAVVPHPVVIGVEPVRIEACATRVRARERRRR